MSHSHYDCHAEHHHDHEHCSCHDHHHGEQVIESALVFSRTGQLLGGKPLALREAAEAVRSALLAAAELVAIEGIVPGHLKALLRHGETRCTLSVTRAGICDVLLPPETDQPLPWELTVNIISAIRPTGDITNSITHLFS